MTPAIYLDCDGVLADFETAAARILGAPSRAFQARHGLPAFWKRLHGAGDFYARLPEMPDARELFEGVAHLRPAILTGCPRGGWAEAQKERWASEHFPGTPIITCMAVDKRNYARPGDVLIDDTLKHRQRWEDAGGTFIHHRSARESLERLRRLHPELFPEPQQRSTVPPRSWPEPSLSVSSPS